jgi:heme-degrading monooxygenase HmoA
MPKDEIGKGDRVYVVTNRIPVAPGFEAEFEERFRKRAHLIDRSPGFGEA